MKIRNIAAALLIVLGGAGAAQATGTTTQSTGFADAGGSFASILHLDAGDWTLDVSAEANAQVTSFTLSPGTTAANPLSPDLGTLNDNFYSISATYSNLVAGDYFLQAITTPGTEVTLSVKYTDTSLTPVPEPESYALAFAGLGVVGLLARRRAA
jgi:PEP-CTERM motif